MSKATDLPRFADLRDGGLCAAQSRARSIGRWVDVLITALITLLVLHVGLWWATDLPLDPLLLMGGVNVW